MKQLSFISFLCLFFVLVACDPSKGSNNAPSNPANFSATALSSTEIQLEWTAVTGATGYRLEKQNGSSFSNLANLSADVTTYTDKNLTPDTSYTYRIKAIKDTQSSAGLQATAKTESDAGPGFTIQPDPATLTLTPGGNSSVALTLQRTGGFTEAIALSLEGDVVGTTPDKITGTFTPNPSSAGTSTLNLTVGTSVAAGDYTLTLRAVAGTQNKTATLNVKINAARTILLVDDDRSDNNDDPTDATATPSESDKIFSTVLTALGKGFDTFVVPSDSNGATFEQMKNYQVVIWYTGSQYGGESNVNTVSSTDEINLKTFLDQESRRLILFSNEYIYGLRSDTSWTTTPNTFLKDYIGLVGARPDRLNNQSFTAKGVESLTDGLSLQVADDAPISTYTAALNKGTNQNTFPLFTANLDPDGNGSADTPIATVKIYAGETTSSVVMFLAFSYENIVDIGANSKQAVMQKLLEFTVRE